MHVLWASNGGEDRGCKCTYQLTMEAEDNKQRLQGKTTTLE